MKIVLTGGTGFLGKSILKSFLNEGCEVIVISRRKDFSDAFDGVEFVKPDLESINRLFIKHNNIDVVVHAATDYGRSGEDITSVFFSNVYFPMTLMNAAINNSVALFVNIDSFFNDGAGKYSYLGEYALSKRNFQEWGSAVASRTLINFINLKMFHLYGPNDGADKFIPSTILACLRGDELDLTLGEQKRDFIFVQDAVVALNLIIKKELNSTSGYVNYDIGSGSAISIREMVEKIKSLTGSHSQLNFGAVPSRVGEFEKSVANISMLRSLGWPDLHSLEDGLNLTIKSYMRLSHDKK
jgi:nucleoside-diphosphate-sugar epimerase